MEIKVLKFGGTSLADGSQFKKVANIVRSDIQRRYIVASAPGKRFNDDVKVTDMLYESFKLAKNNDNIDEIFQKIEDRFNMIIHELNLSFSLDNEFKKIKREILNHGTSDYISSRGEYLNAMILAEYLGFDFIDAAKVIFFNEDGSFDEDTTNKVLSNTLKNHEYAIIPGFYGSMPNGDIKTFSRGGSDITGSIVASTINASIYENWTDVSGMLMADPRIVDKPQVIDVISYRELRELSYMGATVIHEDAIFPVRKSAIPINIRNTNRPSDNGTMIVPSTLRKDTDKMITGVAGKTGFSSITIEKAMMNQELGFGRKVLEIFERHKISFQHLPTGIDTMSVIVDTPSLIDIADDISTEIYRYVKADKIKIVHGLAMIAIVGRNLLKTKDSAARLFTALYKADINIQMIDQGSSELNFIVGVADDDYPAAIKAIYDEFVRK
ncbi:MAG: aspartate kinase [Tissierellia bacterium]|nr:aspartate kinase [Tissierellia bacterium]